MQATACDCHVHLFDPTRFPYATGRAYTPPPAGPVALRALHGALGIERAVLVQPSVYRTDNRCLLDGLRKLGKGRARGIAVVDLAAVTEAELWALHDAGVRGLRLNLHVSGDGLADARQQIALAQRLHALPGWSLQAHAGIDVLASLLDDFLKLEIPIALDHYAGASAPERNTEAALVTVLQAMRNAPVYVKLSAPYRLPASASVAALARRFHDAAPTQIVWGSDWPHTGGAGGQGRSPEAIEPFREVDNVAVLQSLLAALPDAAARHRLLVSNPAALYGFD